jgi:probable rRNA maturation factor
MAIRIDLNTDQSPLAVSARRIKDAVRCVLTGEGVQHARISVAIVDDPTIHGVNHRHLQHDYPTDVLSFVLDDDADSFEGEIVASGDTALREAARYGWQPEDELLLYVVHGALHLTGQDDATPAALDEMRRREQHYLAQFGLQPRYEVPSAVPDLVGHIAEQPVGAGAREPAT